MKKGNPLFSNNDFDPLIDYKQMLTNPNIKENDKR